MDNERTKNRSEQKAAVILKGNKAEVNKGNKGNKAEVGEPDKELRKKAASAKPRIQRQGGGNTQSG